MTVEPFPLFADGHRLDADLHLPEPGVEDSAPPVVIAASGYQGLKILHPERFARALTPRGFAVLTFDYRGFGASEGERGRLAPQDWTEDVRAAVDRLTGCELVDTDRIGLLGWALGGGVVIAEAAEDPRVRAVAAVNAIGDGERAVRHMHDQESWDRLRSRIDIDRRRRAKLGRSEITSPWDIVRLDLDQHTSPYVLEELYRTPGYGSGVTLQSAELLLRFSPERVVARLAGTPLLIVHGDRNALHPPAEAQSLHERAGDPKQLIYLEGVGHTEWMFDDHPTFLRLVDLLDEFFCDAMRPTPDVTATKG
jgi:pimeloyl-ACP methyl ester carboxylesterase